MIMSLEHFRVLLNLSHKLMYHLLLMLFLLRCDVFHAFFNFFLLFMFLVFRIMTLWTLMVNLGGYFRWTSFEHVFIAVGFFKYLVSRP